MSEIVFRDTTPSVAPATSDAVACDVTNPISCDDEIRNSVAHVDSPPAIAVEVVVDSGDVVGVGDVERDSGVVIAFFLDADVAIDSHVAGRPVEPEMEERLVMAEPEIVRDEDVTTLPLRVVAAEADQAALGVVAQHVADDGDVFPLSVASPSPDITGNRAVETVRDDVSGDEDAPAADLNPPVADILDSVAEDADVATLRFGADAAPARAVFVVRVGSGHVIPGNRDAFGIPDENAVAEFREDALFRGVAVEADIANRDVFAVVMLADSESATVRIRRGFDQRSDAGTDDGHVVYVDVEPPGRSVGCVFPRDENRLAWREVFKCRFEFSCRGDG